MNYQNQFDENLKKRFFNAYKFPKHDIYKFISLLHKGVYPYEYMDDWKKFNKTLLPEKENFYSHLNMEDITDADNMHAKRVCKNLKKKFQENIVILCSKQFKVSYSHRNFKASF